MPTKGRAISRMVHNAFMPPDSSRSRNRSPKTLTSSQNQMTKRKNSRNQRKTSPLPNVASGSITGAPWQVASTVWSIVEQPERHGITRSRGHPGEISPGPRASRRGADPTGSLPLDGARGLRGDVHGHAVDLGDLVGDAGRDLLDRKS